MFSKILQLFFVLMVSITLFSCHFYGVVNPPPNKESYSKSDKSSTQKEQNSDLYTSSEADQKDSSSKSDSSKGDSSKGKTTSISGVRTDIPKPDKNKIQERKGEKDTRRDDKKDDIDSKRPNITKRSEKEQKEELTKELIEVKNPSPANFQVSLWLGDKEKTLSKDEKYDKLRNKKLRDERTKDRDINEKEVKEKLGKDRLSFQVTGLPEKESISALLFYVNSKGEVEFLSPTDSRRLKEPRFLDDNQIKVGKVYTIKLDRNIREKILDRTKRGGHSQKDKDFYKIIVITKKSEDKDNTIRRRDNRKDETDRKKVEKENREVKRNNDEWSEVEEMLNAIKEGSVIWATDTLTLDEE